ncbi:MAG: OmpA family protein [Gammaproteobacteria bacterium]|nr:OmpA family protein [Gammaproteobacteria bacterium]NND59472.1 OmpA family protein [Gammaproteobacteria bacterium]
MSEEDQTQEEVDPGAPAWVMTFADLMSLLMCFFVLMLAFSEMDAQRFKLLSGSMRNAFGVQAEIDANMMPRGTSIITKEFSPGKPQPTALKTMRQFTVNSNRNTLDVFGPGEGSGPSPREVERDARRIRHALAEEIEQDKVDVELEGTRIIIRINEQASFPSGSDAVMQSFLPVLTKIRGLLGEIPGGVAIAGHTDDIPINTTRFRSNWELSAARAVSVAHELLREGIVEPDRVAILGHADTQPRVENDSAANRARNRRVEITVIRGAADVEQEPLQVQPEASNEEEPA